MRSIEFALIGCGKIAYRHADAIQQCRNAKLTAICDINLASAQKLAQSQFQSQSQQQPSHIACYTDFQQMLREHPNIDVVTLLTPSGQHYHQALTIIQQFGKHVMLEKPMVLTMAHANHLKTIADQCGTCIFPIFQHRFNKSVQYVRANLGENKPLGRLRVGTVRVRWCRPERYYNLSDWRGTWAMDGGALTNQGIHFIDLLRTICGEVKQVHAKLATLGARIEVEDTALAILEFEQGALGVIEIMTSARPNDFEASISCVCEKGLAVISGDAINRLQLFTPNPTQENVYSETVNNSYGYGHNVIMQNVGDHLLLQKPLAIDFADAFKTLQLLHALYQSDETNGWVHVKTSPDSKRLG